MSQKKKIALFFFLFIPFISFSQITSVQTGDWNKKSTWDCNCKPGNADDVIISSGHTVTLDQNNEVVNSVTVNSGGVLNADNRDLTISGDLVLDGTYTSSNGAKNLTFTGGGTVSGTGNMDLNSKKLSFTGNSSILSGTDLKIFGKIEIDPGVEVTNNGTVEVSELINGRNNNAQWTNATNSTLITGTDKLMDTGILSASATGNTVEYNRGGDQEVQCPTGSQYWNLIINGSGTKSLLCCVDVDGNLKISGGSLDCNGFCIDLAGDWVNSGGTFLEGNQTVTFDGGGDQTFTAIGGEDFWDLTINKGGGDLLLNNDITALHALTLNGGVVDAGSNVVTVGDGCGNEVTTLNWTAGWIIGQLKLWVEGTGLYEFPVGTASNNRKADLNITGFQGGITCGTVTTEFIASGPGSSGLPLEDPDATSPQPDTVYNTCSDGYWRLTQADGIAVNGYDMTVDSAGVECFTVADYTRLLYRGDGGSDWTMEGTHDAAQVKRTGMSSFGGHYTIGDTVNCQAPSVGDISGSNSVCRNQSGVNYSTTADPSYNYSWTITGGVIASGAGTDAITVDWNDSGQVGNVEVLVSNACTQAPPVDTNVTVGSVAPSSITGKNNVAANTTGETYSVSGRTGYSYNWDIDGGTIANGQGTASIDVDWGGAGSGEVKVVADDGSCPESDTVRLSVKIYVIINSVQDGDWDDPATWDCSCVPNATSSVRVRDSVALQGNNTVANNVIITSGSVLYDNNKSFEVTGDFIVDGRYEGVKDITLSGSNTYLDGTGSINNNDVLTLEGGSKTISSTAVLEKTNGIVSVDAITVTNNGSFSISGGLDPINNPSWVQGTNATLAITGSLLDGGGTLYASNSGNTVTYNGTTDQKIKCPNNNQYWHLKTKGTGVKLLQCCTDIDGNLTIGDGSKADCNGFCINLAGDWSDNSTAAGPDPFNEQSNVVTFDGSTDQLVTVANTTQETFYDVTVDKAAGQLVLAGGSNMEISNSLTLTNGIIDASTNGQRVIFPTDAAQSTDGNPDSYVAGLVERTGTSAFTYPIGKDTIWARLATTATVNTETVTFEAEYFPSKYSDTSSLDPINNVSMIEHWVLDRTNGADSVQVRLHWEDTTRSKINDMASNDLRVARYNGADWVDEGQNAITSGDQGDVTSGVIENYSPFTFASLGGSQNPLPIELLDFKAKVVEDKNVSVEWSTASEENTDHFVTLRSKDGRNYEPIAEVEAAGTSYETNHYQYTDTEPYTGTSYYKLKQVDIDGESAMFGPAAVELKERMETPRMGIYPNPSNSGENVYLELNGFGKKEVLVVVRDMLGKEYYSKVMITKENQSTVSAMDLNGKLKNGVYLVIATSENSIYKKKLVISN